MKFFNWNFLNILLAIINPIPYTSYAVAYGMQLESPTDLFTLSTWHSASSSSIEFGLLYGIPQYIIIMFISATVLPSTISGFKVLLSKRDNYNAVFKLSIYILCALSAAIIAGTIAWSATATHTPIELLFTTISTFSFVVFNFLTRFLGSKRIFELVDRLKQGNHLNQFKMRAQLIATTQYQEGYFFNKYRILHYIGLLLAINTLFTWPIFAAQGSHFLQLIHVSSSPLATQFFSYILSVSSWMFYAASAYYAPTLLDVYFRDTWVCHQHNGISYALFYNILSKGCLLAGFYFATYSLQGLAQFTVNQHLLDYLGAQNLTIASFLVLQAHFNTGITSAGASLPLLINRNKKKYTDPKECKSINLALHSEA